MRIGRFVGPLLAAVIPYLLFEALRNGILPDPRVIMPHGHFYIVSAASLLAAVIAAAVGIAGRRLRNIKVSFLALSFISLSLIFMLHGLSTPNFLLSVTHVPAVSAQISMLLASFWLWLSSLPSDHRLTAWLSRRHDALLPGWITGLLLFSIVCMIHPHIMDFLPLTAKPLNGLVTAVVVLLNAYTMWKYYQTYRYSRFPLQLSIVYSAGLFITTQLIMVLGDTWQLSWWMYHFLLLASMTAMLIGMMKQYSVKGSLAPAMRALFTNDPFERMTSSLSPSVKALIAATEKKDSYTAGHTFRVAMYAFRLAEELRLAPEQIRAIAQGTLVHDVGKISIPDAVLNKPSRLDAEERFVIEKHPEYGYEMCRGLGFMKEELQIVRSHHEKWDGTGYPDRLRGEEIHLLARIVAVADVYDALTSERSYREAWSHEKAVSFLIEQSGKHFDPECVEAWVRLCERNPSVYQYPSHTINNENAGSLLSMI